MADHSHGHPAAPDHVPHVTPLKVYLGTWGALVFLTAVTVAASYVNFGAANLIIALVIATIKAAVVAAMFMHLLHDHKMHALTLVTAGLFLAIFISFTMFDTEYRGRADSIEGERSADITRPFEGTKSLAALKAQWPASAATGAATAAAASADVKPEGSAIPGSSVGAPAPSESAPPAGALGPASSASAGASVTASANPSVAPPPAASIAPAPGAPKPPAASAHP